MELAKIVEYIQLSLYDDMVSVTVCSNEKKRYEKSDIMGNMLFCIKRQVKVVLNIFCQN